MRGCAECNIVYRAKPGTGGYTWCPGYLLTWTDEAFTVVHTGTWREVLCVNSSLQAEDYRGLRGSTAGFCEEGPSGRLIAAQMPDGSWSAFPHMTAGAVEKLQVQQPSQFLLP